MIKRARRKPRGDADLVGSIIEHLEKGGPLREWRPHGADRSIPRAKHVRLEAQKSIDRVRLRQTFKRHDDFTLTFADEHGEEHRVSAPPRRTEADYHNAARALRKIGDIERADQLQAVRQWPPPRANAVKYFCALEAFDLMAFSARRPSGVAGRPFRMIAAMLCEAVTGKPHTDIDMERACDAVLKDRRKYHPQAFLRP